MSKRIRGSGSRATRPQDEDEPAVAPVVDPAVPTLLQGIEFVDNEQRTKWMRLVQSPRVCTRFGSIPELEYLYIGDGVRTLFRNIGWQGLLDLRHPGYLGPTLEFASSVHTTPNTLHFRLFNAQHQLSFCDLAQLIRAPSLRGRATNLFYAGQNLAEFTNTAATFWARITDGEVYEPSHAKASLIVHPVLRVAHRILACSVHAREEPTTVSQSELRILHAMVYPDRRPCFGHALCQRLKQYGNRSSGAIACGGIVTLISTHPRIPNIPANLEPMPGTPILGYPQLRQMKMLDEVERGTFVWNVGREKRPFLRVDRANRAILALADPVSDTDWRLQAHRFDGGNQPAPAAPIPAPLPHQAVDPPEGVHPWVFQHINQLEQNFAAFQVEQQRSGAVVDQIWHWAQHQNPQFHDPDSDSD